MKESSQLVMDVLPPSQLHILLRIGNHVYKFMTSFNGGVWKLVAQNQKFWQALEDDFVDSV